MVAEAHFCNWLLTSELVFKYVGSREFEYDFIVWKGEKQITIDVKCKARNVAPEPWYDGHVSEDQLDFKCDAYVFANVTAGVPTIMGWIPKKEFIEVATVRKQGDVRQHSGFEEKKDSRTIEYRKLRSIQGLMQWLSK